MDRALWTDERIDDLATRTEGNFELLLQEIRDLRKETREELLAIRADISA